MIKFFVIASIVLVIATSCSIAVAIRIFIEYLKVKKELKIKKRILNQFMGKGCDNYEPKD